MIGENVVELVTLPKGRSGRPSRAMTEAQIPALFAAAAGDRLEAAIKVAVVLAMRPGELRGMDWSTWSPGMGGSGAGSRSRRPAEEGVVQADR